MKALFLFKWPKEQKSLWANAFAANIPTAVIY